MQSSRIYAGHGRGRDLARENSSTWRSYLSLVITVFKLLLVRSASRLEPIQFYAQVRYL